MTSHYIKVNGLNIHYIQKLPKKDNTKHTIIFLHGRALSVALWEHQFTDSILANYQLIALDLPGHGVSGRSLEFDNYYSLHGVSDILVKFVDQLQLENFILVGHSFGGHIALQSLNELPKCAGLFLVTIPLTKPMRTISMYQDIDLLSNVFSEAADPANLSIYAAKLVHACTRPVPEFIISTYDQSDKKIHTGILNGLLAEKYLDETELIKKSSVPIAIVAGSGEQIHNLNYVLDFDLLLWRNELQLIDEAGHLAPWENPKDFNLLLKAFCVSVFNKHV